MKPLIGTQVLMVKHGVNKMKKIKKLFILPLLALSLFNVNNTQLTNSQFQLEETTNDKNIVGIRKEITSTPNNDVKVSNILKVQASNVENGKRSLRFVAGISSLSLKAHFHRDEIKVNDVIMKANDIAVTCAYSKILNGSQEQTASEVFGNEYNYFVAYTLKDIPEEYWFTEINISLFVNQEKKTYRNANVYGALDNFSDTFAYSDDHKAVGLNSNIANTIESVNIPQYYYEITKDEYNLVADKNNKTQIEEVGRQAFGVGGESFNFNSSSLKHIVFPNQIKKIGNSTFYNCVKIEKIVLPSTLESIGNHSFYNCVNLKEIIIPESVKSIGGYAFMECYSLGKIVFSSESAVKSEGLFGLHDTNLKVYDRCSNVSKLNSYWSYSAKQYYVYSETTRTASQEDISNGINGYWHYNENNEPVKWENSTVKSK